MHIRFATVTALLGIVVLGLAGLAFAGTTTGSLSVSATVGNNCQITNWRSLHWTRAQTPRMRLGRRGR